ncbi:MAG: ATP-binding protein [Melioribacter sp.]|nr:ATP-binding protein [Melioribacter sp.]
MSIKHLIKFIILFVLHCYTGLKAQTLDTSKLLTQYVLDNWTTKEGLPQNSAYSIIQTKDGFIWFGTEEGFVRYDGIRFTVFNPDNILEMKSSLVVNIIEDRQGFLWVGTFDGLLKYSPKESKLFTIKDGLSNNMIRSLYEDEYGRIWVGTSNGLNYIEKNKVIKFTQANFLYNQIIYKIIGDNKGKIYLATQNSGVVIIDISNNGFNVVSIDEKRGLVSNYVRALMIDNDKLFVGTDKGLDLIVNYKVQKHKFKDKLHGIQIMDIIKDGENIFYLGTNKGLCRIKNGELEFYSLEKDLENNLLLDLFLDKEKNLWIGSYNNGLYRMRDGNFTTFSTEEGLKEKFIRAITQNSKGIWIASTNGYLSLVNKNKIKNYFLKREDNSIIQTMTAKGDTLWIGTRNGLYFFYNDNFEKIKNSEFSISALYVDSKKRLLVGSGNKGLFELKKGKLISLSIDERSSKLGVRFIAENKDGSYYLATVGQGLIKYDGKSYYYFTEENGLPSNIVYYVCVDGRGILWFTSSGSGIVRYDGKNFLKVMKKNGLPTNEIQSILEDNKGYFWCGFNNGIFRVSKYEIEKFLRREIDTIKADVFNASDGLKNSECNGGYQGITFKDNFGRFWFSTIDGATFVNPNKLYFSDYTPPIHITRVLQNFEPTELMPVIKAKAGTNILRFDYIAPSFIQPNRLKYRYILEGYEKDWREVRNRRNVIYHNLGPGEYKFRVKVSNYNNKWNDEEASVRVIIPPYFYQTKVFQLLSPIFLLALIFLVVKWRVSKQEKLTKKLEELVKIRTEELKNEIIKKEQVQKELKSYAQELERVNKTKDKFLSIISHDLRNPINSIFSISEFLYDNRDELTKEEFDDMLLQIKNSSQNLNRLIENLLDWSRIQTSKIEYYFQKFNLNEVIENVILTLKPYATPKNIELVSDCKEELYVFADKTSVESVLMNLVTNAIKFSYPKSFVKISTNLLNRSVLVEVEDKGIGISKDNIEKIFSIDYKYTTIGTSGEKGTGLGLILCKEHIERNQGKLWIESELNKGTKVFFTLPLSK